MNVDTTVRGLNLAGILSLAAALSVPGFLLAGCSNEAAIVSYADAHGLAAEETIQFAIGDFPDATIDITVDVVDSATLATLFSQSSPAQTTPFSATFSFPPTPVNVSMTVAFHLKSASAIHNGTNATAGTTLTDGAWYFGDYALPLFVVDNPTAPTVIADVQAVGVTTLTLNSAFPAGPYYLYQTRQMNGTITRTYRGTSSLAVFAKENAPTPVQFTTAF